MNFCIVTFQAVLLAVLAQYHYINEVEAEKQTYVSVGNWFNSMEKKIENVPENIRMNKAYQHIKRTTENIFAYPGRFIHQVFGPDRVYKYKDTLNKDYNEGVKISDLLSSQEMRDLIYVNDISDITDEVKYEAEPEAPSQAVLEKEEAPKRKRRVKKHKKKNKSKREPREHTPHEQRLVASVEQDKAKVEKRVVKKNHKKRVKERINQRKFVKTLLKESNSSESDEVKKRKPVDIIVHIKMND